MENMRMKKVIVVTVVLVVLGVGGGVWKFYTSPKYSLRIIQKAIEEHDVTTFEKHVDIEGLISRLLGEFLGLLSGKEELRVFGQEAVHVIQEFAKETIVRSGKTAVETFIERGHFDREITETGVLSKFAKGAQIEDLDFVGLKEIKQEGKICHVTVVVHVGTYDGDLEVTFMMRDKGTYWQIAEISNVSALLNRIAELRKAYRFKDLSAATLYLLETDESPDKFVKAKIYRALAYAAVKEGQVGEAERLLEKSLAVCATMTEPSWSGIRAECVADAGVIYFQSGQKDKGRELIRSVATGSTRYDASGFHKIAVELAEQGKIEEALAEVSSISDAIQRAGGFVKVAATLDRAGNKEEGLEVLQQATETIREVDDAWSRGRLFGVIGRALALSGADEKANDLFAIAEENVEGIDDARARAGLWLGLSWNLLDAGRREAAAKAVSKAIDGLGKLQGSEYDTNSKLVRAAVVLHKLGRKRGVELILQRVPHEELRERFRSSLLHELIKANKDEEAISSASQKELSLVTQWLAEDGKVELALSAVRQITDRKQKQSHLLWVAGAALSSHQRKGKQPDIARQIMTIADAQ
jgi:tetratricopeptide (TPR) repeat protein